MDDRGSLLTEHRLDDGAALDSLSTIEAFRLINRQDATIAAAVAGAEREICAAIELVVEGLRRGGRLWYVGAGTSGRLGVLDAAECPPTFLTDPRLIRGIIAGGYEATWRSVEGAEDRMEEGMSAIDVHGVDAEDIVIAVATGGTTPFVHGALMRARQRGAKTVFLACVPREQVQDAADVSIRVLTGPEVVAGSTRLKAGTATKMVLNTISTIALTRLGKVYRGYMVDLNTQANRKLVDRGIRIIQALTGLSRKDSSDLLGRADDRVKTALVMQVRSVSRGEAEALLAQAGGRLGLILDSAHGAPSLAGS